MSSVTFNSVDLSTYGLKVLQRNLPVKLSSTGIQLRDKSISARSQYPPKMISLSVVIEGDDAGDINDKLDSINLVLNKDVDKQLRLETTDELEERYWNARFVALTGELEVPELWRGTLEFICYDPCAYAIEETSSDFNIDADPKTVEETPDGTAFIEPVYTLTAGEALNDITLTVENLTTGEEIQWEGSLANGEELEIDCVNWIVKKEGVADMADVSGQFPRLLPGETNYIQVTGFSNTGTLNITYRARYL